MPRLLGAPSHRRWLDQRRPNSILERRGGSGLAVRVSSKIARLAAASCLRLASRAAVDRQDTTAKASPAVNTASPISISVIGSTVIFVLSATPTISRLEQAQILYRLLDLRVDREVGSILVVRLQQRFVGFAFFEVHLFELDLILGIRRHLVFGLELSRLHDMNPEEARLPRKALLASHNDGWRDGLVNRTAVRTAEIGSVEIVKRQAASLILTPALRSSYRCLRHFTPFRDFEPEFGPARVICNLFTAGPGGLLTSVPWA